ncbi:MAG TPA: hypothetical protein VJ984_13680 [Xanthomonadales bacterium]|nr:hypothetical protein [Xanthomonadales bacterium]
MNAGFFFRGLLVLAVFLYPLLVFFGLKVLPPSFFGLVLVVLLALRFGILRPDERKILLPILLVFLAYALTASILGSERFLLFYPVLVNLSLCFLFAWSLRDEEPLLLRVLRKRGVPMSIYAPRYLYCLTIIWSVFFLLNAAIAAWTTTQSLEVWTIYNGLIAYILVGVLLGSEWLFRIYYKKKKGVHSV